MHLMYCFDDKSFYFVQCDIIFKNKMHWNWNFSRLPSGIGGGLGVKLATVPMTDPPSWMKENINLESSLGI